MAVFKMHYDAESDDYVPTRPARSSYASSSSSCATVTAENPLQVDAEGQAPVGGKRPVTPLPMFQIFIICTVRLAEPIAYTQIFPYINQMVEELHVTDDPSKIGFYSGLVDSLFSFAQLFTVYQWGQLSDRIGRRPVIFAGLLGVALASCLFGLSTNFAGMLVARALAGMLSGNCAIMNSIIGEITDETNQAKAFPLPLLTWSFGCVIGSMLGGTLSHPAERYPEVFGNSQFLKDRPFFLPSFVSSCITVLSFLLGYFCLEETLPRLVAANKAQTLGEERTHLLSASSTSVSSTNTLTASSSYGSIKPSEPIRFEGPALEAAPPSTSTRTAWALLSDKKIFTALSSTFLLSFLSIAWDVVFVLFAYTPIELGGLSKEAVEIGYALSAFGVSGVFAVLFVFPSLHDRFGSLQLYDTLMQLWPLSFAIMPILNWIARYYGLSDVGGLAKAGAHEGNVIVWIGIGLLLIVAKSANMAWGANGILIKTASPDQATLGAMFGLAQSASNIARSTGPAFVSTLFAISVERQVLGGNLVWIVMCGVSFLGVWNARHMAHVNRSSEQDESKSCQAGAHDQK